MTAAEKLSRDIMEDFITSMQEGMEELEEMASAFGPFVMYWWSTDDAYVMSGSILEAESGEDE